MDLLWTRPADLPEKRPEVSRVLMFSDLHLGLFPGWSAFRGKRILGACNHWLFRRRKVVAARIAYLATLLPQIQPDAVVCAGDLGSVALPEEFSWARKELQPIRRWCGERFCYVPGNHDAYVAEPLAREALEETFSLLNGGRWTLEEMPQVFSVRNLDLLLVNGAVPLPWGQSCGVLADEQTALCRKCLATMTQPHRGVVLHFPVATETGALPEHRHGLRGGAFLRQMLLKGEVAAVLSGHVHHPYVFHAPGGGVQVCDGSLTMAGSCAVVDFAAETLVSFLKMEDLR